VKTVPDDVVARQVDGDDVVTTGIGSRGHRAVTRRSIT
jgi:hypothetical protein